MNYTPLLTMSLGGLMTRLQTSPTSVIGYANSFGRSDLPMIEKPIYKNSHGYFTKEDGEETYLSEYELLDAEVNGLFTSLDEAKPVVPDGVILIFEDPDDILKKRTSNYTYSLLFV